MEVAPVAGVRLHQGVLFWISQILLSHSFFSTQLLRELCLVAFVSIVCTVGVVIEAVILFIVGQGISEEEKNIFHVGYVFFVYVLWETYPYSANIVHL